MADISVMNVGGTDYNIKDSTSRTNSTKAMSLSAYYETGNTASQAYSIIGTPINWKGTLYYTKTTVAKGATWVVGTNLTAATNLGKLVRNIKTYVGSDSKLHFVDLTGADTALNFSANGGVCGVYKNAPRTTLDINCGFKPKSVLIFEHLFVDSTYNYALSHAYNSDESTTNYKTLFSSWNGITVRNDTLGDTTNGYGLSIKSNGFSYLIEGNWKEASSYLYYVASK